MFDMTKDVLMTKGNAYLGTHLKIYIMVIFLSAKHKDRRQLFPTGELAA